MRKYKQFLRLKAEGFGLIVTIHTNTHMHKHYQTTGETYKIQKYTVFVFMC